MSKSIFISSVHEDMYLINTLKKWVDDKKLGDVTITHETEDKRHEGNEAIKNYIRKKIEGAAFVFVLIGQDTHNHDWIRAEVELANSFNKKVVCIRIPDSTGAKPKILINYDLIQFELNLIFKEIN